MSNEQLPTLPRIVVLFDGLLEFLRALLFLLRLPFEIPSRPEAQLLDPQRLFDLPLRSVTSVLRICPHTSVCVCLLRYPYQGSKGAMAPGRSNNFKDLDLLNRKDIIRPLCSLEIWTYLFFLFEAILFP